MALTSREREAEMEEAEEAPVVQEPIKLAGDAESEDEDDGTVYNPLNLPCVSHCGMSISQADAQARLGRQAYPILAVQAARTRRYILMRDLRRRHIPRQKR